MSTVETQKTEESEIKTLSNGDTEFVTEVKEVTESDGVKTETVTVTSTIIDAPTESEISEEVAEIIEQPTIEENQDDAKWLELKQQMVLTVATLEALTLTQSQTLTELEAIKTTLEQSSTRAQQSSSVDEDDLPEAEKNPQESSPPVKVTETKREKKPQEKQAQEKPRRNWL